MNYLSSPLTRRPWAGFTALALLGLPMAESQSATFTWGGSTGNWNVGANWGGTAPTGTNPVDVLQFGGDISTSYTSTNNVANPFLLNQLVFNVTDSGALGATHFLAGSPLRFSGSNPVIFGNGAGGVRIDTPIQLLSNLLLTGNGTGVITLNNTVSGTVDIVKRGTSTFRFGTPTISTELPSDNTWFGRLTIEDGTVRFNNNAASGRTALRSNPVVLASATSKLTVSSELRVGTLNGNLGTVEAQVTGTNSDNASVVIHVIGDGTFGGTLRLGAPTGNGDDGGKLIFRGASTQVLTGTLDIYRDTIVGRGATVVLAGTASMAAQLGNGSIVMSGGTFKLDNSVINNNNRLRDATQTSTGLESIGGGDFALIGNAAGTSETVGRLQIGAGQPRSGQLNTRVVHDSGTTILNFMSYSRNSTATPQFTTIDFSAVTTAGATRLLGQNGAGSRITFSSFTVPLTNGLITNSAGTAETGWATVNGTDFATYSSTLNSGAELGVQAVATTAFPGVSSPAANSLLTANAAIATGADFSLNSVKIAPGGPGFALSITSTGNLNNRNFLLAGSNDYTIQNTGSGTGGITGGGTRYFHVQQAALNLDVSLANGTGVSSAIVKAGSGFLNLLKSSSGVTAPVVVNSGTLRSSLANLPAGELRFRGGVYEISGGGTFNRPITFGAGAVNWGGIDSTTLSAIDEDRGSGGFSAFGGNVTIDLGPAGATDLAWEDKGFVNSSFALTFGSGRANSMVTWIDNLRLTAVGQTVNYNAREIRVLDNPAVTTDFVRMSGVVSGLVQDDLLKTGPGTLELTGANTYLGATQVHEGTLRINSTNAASFLTVVRSGAILAGKGTTGPVRIELGGIVAPGDAEGHASILNTGEFRMAGAGAQLSIELGGLTAGGDGTTGYDQVNVSGAVVLDGGALTGLLLGAFLPQAGDMFFIINNDGSDAVQGQFAQGTFISIGGMPFEIGYTGDSGAGTFLGGNDVVLRTIPEPATAALAGAGLCALSMRRRRVTGS
jgi:autotransporter-associated beta strand protein